MILVFLITLIFSIISIYLWFHFPLLSFNKHNLLLVLAALSLIIFLSNSLSYSYLNYEFIGNHLSSINSHLPKCITFSYQKKKKPCNSGKKFTSIEDSPQVQKQPSLLFSLHIISLPKYIHLLTGNSVYIGQKGNDTVFYVMWFQRYVKNSWSSHHGAVVNESDQEP